MPTTGYVWPMWSVCWPPWALETYSGVWWPHCIGGMASFLLHCITPAVPITFSISNVVVHIKLQYLLRLEEVLWGVAFPDLEERVEAYGDDVVAVGEDEEDLLIIDVVMRREWQLQWVNAPQQLKTFGATYTSSLGSTVSLSWEDCLAGVQRVIHEWKERHVSFLHKRRDVLESNILSKLWYLAQPSPLP
jgi:hypothetical protein